MPDLTKVRVVRYVKEKGELREWRIWYECGECLAEVGAGDEYCRMCGIKWEEFGEREITPT